MRFLRLCLIVGCWLAGSAAAVAQNTQPADYNPLHEEIAMREKATTEARKLARALFLNEAQLIQIRDFAFMRMHAENDAQARFSQYPEERQAHAEAAAATFQSQVINLLNDQQMDTYLRLMAKKAQRDVAQQPAPAAPAPEGRKPVGQLKPKIRRR